MSELATKANIDVPPAGGTDQHVPRVFSRPVSRPGVLTGVLFFAVSLLPSMLPRAAINQGVVSGVTFMVGYALGSAWQWAWHYLEIPPPGGRFWNVVRWVWFGFLGLLVVSAMWQHVGFQNDVRDTFGMDRISPAVWLTIVPVTILVAGLVLVTARAIRKFFHFVARWLNKIFPRRLSLLLGGLVVGLLFWGLWSGVLVNGFFTTANAIFEPRDKTTDEGVIQPDSELRSGGPDSVVSWESLGRKGRAFVAGGPTVDDLNKYHGAGAIEPIRVYAGLKSAEDEQGRADLVLEELIRTNAFDREVLVVATTTGTGFLEPNAVDALEYVYKGDTAIAGVQYSYLPSWISLVADQEKVKKTSQVVFDTIHEYWSTLPEDERPEIYVYGLSLGSYGVESILGSIDVINEPIDGALMVGPPFVNPIWNDLVDNRDPASTPATPIYRRGKTFRFTNEINALDLPTGTWGDTRVVYLQHASDPVVFFSPNLALREPDWLLDGQKGVEISEDFEWIPFVTMWQVFIDLPAAGSVPEGFGHLYTRGANAEAWIAVTRPDNWTDQDTQSLKDYLATLPPAEEE